MSRSSYFQRITRADRGGSMLRPPPAIFRRWETTQMPTAWEQPAALDKSPIAAEPGRKLSQSSAASLGPRTSIQPTGAELSAVPDHLHGRSQKEIRPNSDRPTEKNTTHTVKSSARIGPVQAEEQPARTSVQRKHQGKPEATSGQITTPRNVNSTTRAQPRSKALAPPDATNLSLNPLAKSERPATGQTLNPPAREALNSFIDKTVATSASDGPGERKSDETPRPLQAHYRSHERRDSIPAPPLAPLQAAEKSHPTVKIGTIDVQITPTPSAKPQLKMARSSTGNPATALSRGFTSSFGLRQG